MEFIHQVVLSTTSNIASLVVSSCYKDWPVKPVKKGSRTNSKTWIGRRNFPKITLNMATIPYFSSGLVWKLAWPSLCPLNEGQIWSPTDLFTSWWDKTLFQKVFVKRPGRSKTPKGDLWRGNWLPYSRLIREKDESFSGGGINVHPVEFMRSWKIDFAGTVKNVSTLEEKKVTRKSIENHFFL